MTEGMEMVIGMVVGGFLVLVGFVFGKGSAFASMNRLIELAKEQGAL